MLYYSEGDDVDVSVEDNTLKVTGERRYDEDESKGAFQRVERFYGKFSAYKALFGKYPKDREGALQRGVRVFGALAPWPESKEAYLSIFIF